MRKSEGAIIKDAESSRRKKPGPIPNELKPSFGSLSITKRGPTIVTDNIVLGSRDDSQDFKLLAEFGITHILNVAVQLPNVFPDSFIYEKLDLIDSAETNVGLLMPKAIEFLRHIESVNGRCFIHCISGVSRSVTVLLMYLITEHRLHLRDCYEYIKSYRPFIAPNEGFKMQLALCEIRELGYSTVGKDGKMMF
jgi:protein-tyrosine phosphatase